MDMFNRRQFLKIFGAAAAMAALPRAVGAATTAPRVVVVGGGLGGATAAKYLRLWGGNIDVTLVDPKANHITCILSNLVVTGDSTLARITLPFTSLRDVHGVNVVQARATRIDPVAQKVTISDGTATDVLEYDHLILSPGIEFVDPNPDLPGLWNPGITPHAWIAGVQTTFLQSQLAKMRNGGLFVLTVPKSPYRCPPGPYERACVVADYLQREKPRSKVLVLDANSGIQAEPNTFTYAFNELYADILTYTPNANITRVDSPIKTVYVDDVAVKGHVVNYIPQQKAGTIVARAGLTAGGLWAPVDVLNYASTLPGMGNIHIIGDSQGSANQPKSGHMANAQAKICADAIIRAFNGEAPDPQPVTASACYTTISSTTASWLSVGFQYDPATRTMVALRNVDNPDAPDASYGESATISTANFRGMSIWADNIFADSYL